MNMELLLLSLAALFASSLVISGAIAAIWPWLSQALHHLTPAAESRLLLAIAALPLVMGMLVLVACFSPDFGFTTDHCLQHQLHHPHLCLSHLPNIGTTLTITLMASAFVIYSSWAFYRFGRGLWKSHRMGKILCLAAPNEGGIRVLPSDKPEAFVVGLFRPALFASRGLLSMPPYERDVVLAHESAHILRRDPLRALLASALLAFHLPGISGIIWRRVDAYWTL